MPSTSMTIRPGLMAAVLSDGRVCQRPAGRVFRKLAARAATARSEITNGMASAIALALPES